MDKEYFIKHLIDLNAQQIAKGIRAKIVEFPDLKKTGVFDLSKQKLVLEILEKFTNEDEEFYSSNTVDQFKKFLLKFPQSELCEKAKIEIERIENKTEEEDYNLASTLILLREFLSKYPYSEYVESVKNKIENIEKEDEENMKDKYDEIKRNINDYKPDEVKAELGEDFLRDLCNQLGIDYNVVVNYDEPTLEFNEIPKIKDDVPEGFTDVFFWGIPSSGKTCALSVILRTMKDKYSMTSPPIATKFGSTYRDSLVNIFSNKTGYLPAATQKDRTQYMPLLLKKRNNDKDKYRQISFFELSGEVFKYFYELENGSNILAEDDRDHVESAFNTLNLLLNSNNKKIHFFFIDYKQETKGIKDKHNLTQENYLSAAATYFRDKNDIFKKKTDAVYIVVTKADEIKAENKTEKAKDFLNENFGSFIDSIEVLCKRDSVHFNVKLFSIGDVYFKGICKINYYYAENIVEDLLRIVKPINESRFAKFMKR